MKSQKTNILLALLLSAFSTLSMADLPALVQGPDKALSVRVLLEQGKAFYQVSYQDHVFIEKSSLGLITSLGDFSQNLTFVANNREQVVKNYTMNRAKVSQVNYAANKLVTRFANDKGDMLDVIFHVSNNDVAFSYYLHSSRDVTRVKIFSETTSFNLPDKATTFISPQALPMTGWQQTKPSYEEPYTYDEAMGTPSLYGVGYTFPALFKNEHKGWILISETGVDSH